MVFLSSHSNKAQLWERNLKCEWLGLEAVDVFVRLRNAKKNNDRIKNALLVLCRHTNTGMSNTVPDKSVIFQKLALLRGVIRIKVNNL